MADWNAQSFLVVHRPLALDQLLSWMIALLITTKRYLTFCKNCVEMQLEWKG